LSKVYGCFGLNHGNVLDTVPANRLATRSRVKDVNRQTEMIMSVDTNKQTACRFVERLSEGKVDAAMLGDDFVHWTAIGGEMNRSGLIAAMDYMGDLFVSPFQIHVDGITAEGSRVAMEAHSVGELRSGASYRNTYHFLFEFAPDGRIRRINEHMDTKHALDVMRPPAA
jgi:ketosteroid isomerase-like protein